MAKRNYMLWGCLGCGGFVFLIFLVLASGIGWVAFQTYEYGQQIQVMYQDLDQNYQDVDSQFPFTPPENNRIDEGRYQDYLKIRSELAGFSEKYIAQFEDIGKKIGEQFESAGLWDKLSGVNSIKEIISTGIKMPTEIGGEHVRLLIQTEMSNHEYVWLCTSSLGSLYQSEKNQYNEGAELWKQYRTQLDEIRTKMDEINIHQNDMNISMDNFLQKLDAVSYQKENAELAVNNSELLLALKQASILDYFSVQINELISKHRHSTNAGQTE